MKKTQEKLKYKIYVDTAQRDAKSVRLVKLLDGVEEEVGKDIGDIDVNTSIKNLIDKNNLVLQDISEFVPNLGPGSFTGLKIGVTISNLFNWLLGRKTLDGLSVPEYGGEPNISDRKERGPINN